LLKWASLANKKRRLTSNPSSKWQSPCRKMTNPWKLLKTLQLMTLRLKKWWLMTLRENNKPRKRKTTAKMLQW